MNGDSTAKVGRPRSEKTRQAILKAAFRLLRKHSFEAVTNQQIAKAARVSSATIYRWWKNKEAVLLEAYLETTRQLLPYGTRGSPLKRLRRYTLRVAEFLRSADGRVFLRLMVAIQDNAKLRKDFYNQVFVPRRAEGCQLVQQAVLAGELPEWIDPDLLINALIGPLILPALMGRYAEVAAAEKLFDFVIRATYSK